MSFILDALKKSDSKRQAESFPRLETVHRSVPLKRRRLLRLPLLLVILLLSTGTLLWVFGLPQQAQEKLQPVVTEPATQKQEIRQPKPAAVPVPTPVPVTTPEPEFERSNQPVIPEAVAPPREDRVYLISNLPAAIQQGLPALHISLHAYSKADPNASMVRVNGQILRAGTQLSDKYLLEEITADGAIFRYQGYRFRIPR